VGDLAEVRQGGLPIDFVESGVDLVIRFDALSDKRLNARWTMSNRRLTCIRYRPNAAAADPSLSSLGFESRERSGSMSGHPAFLLCLATRTAYANKSSRCRTRILAEALPKE
jgi:hypothetical protein